MKIKSMLKVKKYFIGILCLCLVLPILGCNEVTVDNNGSAVSINYEIESSSEAEISSSKPEESSSEVSTSSAVSQTASKKPVQSKPASVTAVKPSANVSYTYNSNIDIENNLFLDALAYTGYNIKKQRADGMMWKYVLWTDKEWRGWLSGIHYGGGSSGYETVNGKPDLTAFKKGGLVCASYATYVYFNYLPNVAGIDTSSLARPARSTSANDWYNAAKDWEKKGYSKRVPFKFSGTAGNFAKFSAQAEIPIGSVVIFCDYKHKSDFGSHVAIYQGYKNGYHWLAHVGNKNGPEFCAIERMLFGADPQWLIAIFTTPSNIRMSAMINITLKDDSGNPIQGVEFSLKNSAGKTVALGKTDKNGVITKEGLAYGNYTLNEALPSGYKADNTSRAIKLTTANNSVNSFNIVNKKIVVVSSAASSVISDKQTDSSIISDNSSNDDISNVTSNQ